MGKTKTAFVGETIEQKKQKKPERKSGKVHIAGLKGGQRIKMVETDLPAEVPTEAGPAPSFAAPSAEAAAKAEKASKSFREPKVRSKNYQAAKSKVTPGKTYDLAEAIKLIKDTSYSAFDGTMEIHLVVKKAGVSANVTLPHPAGREKKVEVASDETIKKLEAGKIDFDVLLATAEMMPKLVPFAKILGPKGLMPNPKNGTLVKETKDKSAFIRQYSSAQSVVLRTEKEAPLIHTTFGKVSQKDEELKENLEAIVAALGGSKQILKAFIKSTMSPSVRISL